MAKDLNIDVDEQENVNEVVQQWVTWGAGLVILILVVALASLIGAHFFGSDTAQNESDPVFQQRITFYTKNLHNTASDTDC